MTSCEALQSLGVHPELLSAGERSFLNDNGYLLLDDILTEDKVAYFRNRLDELGEIEGDDAGSELHQEEGTVRLANLLDNDKCKSDIVSYCSVILTLAKIISSARRLNSSEDGRICYIHRVVRCMICMHWENEQGHGGGIEFRLSTIVTLISGITFRHARRLLNQPDPICHIELRVSSS